jgi:catechol 2,3-dioxygenase-like lactoylglutathione lyase family enzyme
MFDHIAIGVSNVETSARFFLQALQPLGVRVVAEAANAVGLSSGSFPCFWLDQKLPVSRCAHLAFSAQERGQVDEFHSLALAAGGKDNGRPGIRAHYAPDYYAAFVIGPDELNIEVVCREAVHARLRAPANA